MDESTIASRRSSPDEYTWRPARREDAGQLYHLYADIDVADSLTSAGSQADAERDFDDPSTRAETDSLVAVSPQGELAAAGWIYTNLEVVREHYAWLWGGVHPKHRQRGLGEALFSWMEERASAILDEFEDGLPRNLRASTPSTGADRIRLLERHGFQPVRQFYKMRRDLSKPISDGQLADGLRMVTWSPELDESVRVAINESFLDHWRFEPIAAGVWKVSFAESSDFRPELSFAVLDGDQMAGAIVNSVHSEDNARQGLSEGWIHLLGIRRPWRGRGLATALINRSMQAFKEARLETAGLGVDTENVSGALRLYENLGFRPVQRTIQYNKAVGKETVVAAASGSATGLLR